MRFFLRKTHIYQFYPHKYICENQCYLCAIAFHLTDSIEKHRIITINYNRENILRLARNLKSNPQQCIFVAYMQQMEKKSEFTLTFDIITILPELLESPLNHSIMKRAKERGLLEVNLISLRAFGIGKHRQVDDYQYGGGSGMVMMPEPISNCIEDLLSKNKYDDVIYLTPDGQTLNQKIANRFSLSKRLMLICGHYKGLDERVRELYVTKEISIGDYVLSGGELAACVLVDSIGRLIPGVLNDETSALSDSFQDNLLAPPVYTRPEVFKGKKVPDILLSGHEKKIDLWRQEQALERTQKRRPDLLLDEE